MFNIEKLQRVATGAVGAFILTTVCVTAAVGPARAVETQTVAVSVQAGA